MVARRVSDRVLQALRVLEGDTGNTWSVASKAKSLRKFGRNDDLGTTRATIWTADELHPPTPTSNVATVVSSSTSDTQTIRIEGHTYDSGNLTFTVQNVTLTGTTDATLSTPLARVTRIFNLSTTTDLTGAVYVHEGNATTTGKPDDTTEIHGLIVAGDQQTEQCFTSVSSVDAWIIKAVEVHVFGAGAARSVDARIEKKASDSAVWLPVGFNVTVTNTSGSQHRGLEVPIIVGPNCDVRFTAVGSGSGIDVGGHLAGVLATRVDL